MRDRVHKRYVAERQAEADARGEDASELASSVEDNGSGSGSDESYESGEEEDAGRGDGPVVAPGR